MLTEAEKSEIDEVASTYPSRRTASIDALLVAQRSRGWISDETLGNVASHLGMTADELDSIATFYSRIFRKPVGKHVISVCDSISCYVMGGETLLHMLERKLGVKPGGTTADGTFTLIPNVCLGHCDLAPVMLVNERLYGNLTEEKISRILDETAAGRPPDGLPA